VQPWKHDPSLIEEGVNQPRDRSFADHVDCPAARRGLRLAAGNYGAECAANHALERTPRPLAHSGEPFEDVRKGLDRAVEAYNKAVGSLEGRAWSAPASLANSARPSPMTPELEPIDTTARTLQLDWGDEEPARKSTLR